MTENKRRAILIAARFVNAVDTERERADESFEMSSLFDAGEFSGPASEREFNFRCDAAARRLGFADAEVAYTVATHVMARR